VKAPRNVLRLQSSSGIFRIDPAAKLIVIFGEPRRGALSFWWTAHLGRRAGEQPVQGPDRNQYPAPDFDCGDIAALCGLVRGVPPYSKTAPCLFDVASFTHFESFLIMVVIHHYDGMALMASEEWWTTTIQYRYIPSRSGACEKIMSQSLKGYTPALARLLGSTPAALYERQRALVRAGLLQLGDGRGPGSGVRTTGASVALLLISVLAAESLSEAEMRSGSIAAAGPRGGERCAITHMKTFRDALAAILVSKGLSRKIVDITVSRTSALATIRFKDGSAFRTSEFGEATGNPPAVTVFATLSRAVIRTLADDVSAIVESSFDQEPREKK
jgi:hypothetical protein